MGPPCAGDQRPVQNLQQNVVVGVPPEQYAHDMAVAASIAEAASNEANRIRDAANEYVRWTQKEVASLVQQASEKYNLDLDAAANAVFEANKRAESAQAEAGNQVEYAKAVAEHAYACALSDMKATIERVHYEAKQYCEQADAKMQANEARIDVAVREANDMTKNAIAMNKAEMSKVVAEYREKTRKAIDAKELQEKEYASILEDMQQRVVEANEHEAMMVKKMKRIETQ